ncbi:MAG: hypothetical protein ABIP46_02425 [Polaromonas sp.]
MNPHKPAAQASRSRLQQQPQRAVDRQQQQSSGSREFQPKQSPAAQQQMGEGSYEGTRDYQENIKSYLETADVKADAKAARPATPQEAAELKKAEQEGLSHSKASGE